MATTTPNLGLTKPAGSEGIDIADLNGDMDLIDTFAGGTNMSLSKLDSNVNSTNDILTDALSCTVTTFFKGSGSSYTGTQPSGTFGYSTFIVTVRNSYRMVLAVDGTGDMFTNVHNGTSWSGWNSLAVNLDVVQKSGDTMTGNLSIEKAGETFAQAKNTSKGCAILLDSSGDGTHGLISNGYWNGSSFVSDGKWLLYRNSTGIKFNGDCTGSAASVAWSGVTGKPSIVDNLSSTSTTDALSANQGKVLNSNIGKFTSPVLYSCSSLDNFKSTISTIVGTMADGEVRNIVMQSSSSFEPFGGSMWKIELHKRSGSYFSGIAHSYDLNRDTVEIKYSNGTWALESLALNSKLNEFYNVPTSTYSGDLNSLLTPGWYLVDNSATNKPPELSTGKLKVEQGGTVNYIRQTYYGGYNYKIYTRVRYYSNGAWQWYPWQEVTNDEINSKLITDVFSLSTAPDIPRGTNFNTLTTVGCFRVRSYSDSATMTNIPVATAGTLYVKNSMLENGANYKQQIYMTHQNVIYLRYTTDNGTTWTTWDSLALNSNIEKRAMGSQATTIPANADLDNYLTYGLFCSGSASVSATLAHCPVNYAGFLLEVIRTSDTDSVLKQKITANAQSDIFYSRWHSNSGWSDWVQSPTRAEITELNSTVSNTVQIQYATSETMTLVGKKFADVNFTLPSAFTNNPKAYVMFNQGSSVIGGIAIRSWTDTTHFNARVFNYSDDTVSNANVTLSIIALG